MLKGIWQRIQYYIALAIAHLLKMLTIVIVIIWFSNQQCDIDHFSIWNSQNKDYSKITVIRCHGLWL